jgi:predicted lipoprotein with Yx(FWY)xxD motif
VKRARFIYVAAIAVAAAVAGCGSSASSTTVRSASAPSHASTPTAASTSTAAPASAGALPALITTKHDKLGTILAYGPKRLTVYLFEADHGMSSACSGACAKVWPPVTGAPKASGDTVASGLGTIKRSDGTTQVTYKGHPLYLFIKDKDDGDTYGQGVTGFGAQWYALAASGEKVDNS